jgi:hypothetical protein
LNSTKKENLDKKWATFFYEANISFNVMQHLVFIEVMKTNSKSQTQTPIIPWIVHRFVEAIQGGCV